MFQTLIGYDVTLLNIIRHLVDTSVTWQVWLVHIFADSQVIAVAIFLIFCWLVGTFRKNNTYKQKALQLFYVVMFAFLVYMILNQLLPVRPRPETVTAIAPIIAHVPDNSFPSGHAIFSATSTFAVFIIFRRKWIGSVSLILAILMCLSRVMAGVHYPGDIIVGWILGIIFAFFFWKIVRKEEFSKMAIEPLIRVASFIGL